MLSGPQGIEFESNDTHHWNSSGSAITNQVDCVAEWFQEPFSRFQSSQGLWFKPRPPHVAVSLDKTINDVYLCSVEPKQAVN